MGDNCGQLQRQKTVVACGMKANSGEVLGLYPYFDTGSAFSIVSESTAQVGETSLPFITQSKHNPRHISCWCWDHSALEDAGRPCVEKQDVSLPLLSSPRKWKGRQIGDISSNTASKISRRPLPLRAPFLCGSSSGHTCTLAQYHLF